MMGTITQFEAEIQAWQMFLRLVLVYTAGVVVVLMLLWLLLYYLIGRE